MISSRKLQKPLPYLNDYSSRESILEGVTEYNEKEDSPMSNKLFEFITYMDDMSDFEYDKNKKIAKFISDKVILSINEFEIKVGANNVILSGSLKDNYGATTTCNYHELSNLDSMVKLVKDFVKMSNYVKYVASELEKELGCSTEIEGFHDRWGISLKLNTTKDRDMYIKIPFSTKTNLSNVMVTVRSIGYERNVSHDCKLDFDELIPTLESLSSVKIKQACTNSVLREYMENMARFVDYGYKSFDDMIDVDSINVSLYDKVINAIHTNLEKFLSKDRDCVYSWNSSIDGLVFYSTKYDKFIILSNIAIIRSDKRKYSKATESGLFAHIAIFSGNYTELYRSVNKINLCNSRPFKELIDKYI